MTSIRRTHGILLNAIGWLTVILTWLGFSTLTKAQQEANYSIPIELQPEGRIYSFHMVGAELNSYIKPLEEPKPKKDKAVVVSFQKDTIRHKITLDLVPGIIKDSSDESQGTAFFKQGWEIRITNLGSVKAKVKQIREEKFGLQKVETDNIKGYYLPENDTFNVEFTANELQADLLLAKNSVPMANNPVKLEQNTAPAGSPIEYHLLKTNAVDNNSEINVLFISEEPQETLRVIPLELSTRKNAKGLWGTAKIPTNKYFNGSWLASKHVNAVVLVTNKNDKSKAYIKVDKIEITSNGMGIFLGILAVLLFLLIIRLGVPVPVAIKKNKERYENWSKLSPVERFCRFPLHFAMTPLGRYSISLTQLLFWTLIVIFAFVYVSYTRGEFLNITQQILILLGISSGTALAAKVTSIGRMSEIPDKYLKGIKQDRIPRFRDLISIGDVPNIFKFQIFAFTLLSGVLVLRELLRTGNFPVLEENLLTLMGISGGVYVANELATESTWKKLEGLIKEINTKNKEYSELDKAKKEERDSLKKEVKSLEGEVKKYLEDIYTESSKG